CTARFATVHCYTIGRNLGTVIGWFFINIHIFIQTLCLSRQISSFPSPPSQSLATHDVWIRFLPGYYNKVIVYASTCTSTPFLPRYWFLTVTSARLTYRFHRYRSVRVR